MPLMNGVLHTTSSRRICKRRSALWRALFILPYNAIESLLGTCFKCWVALAGGVEAPGGRGYAGGEAQGQVNGLLPGETQAQCTEIKGQVSGGREVCLTCVCFFSMSSVCCVTKGNVYSRNYHTPATGFHRACAHGARLAVTNRCTPYWSARMQMSIKSMFVSCCATASAWDWPAKSIAQIQLPVHLQSRKM